MIKKAVLVFLMLSSFSAEAQKYITEKSHVSFFSEAALENITADNKNSAALLDLSTSMMAVSIPIIDFKFEKKLMWEHLNEKYMETDKYPRATFRGKIQNFEPDKEGEQQVSAKGTLTIHGVSQEVEIPGLMEITKNNKVRIQSVFMIKLEDYNIIIPKVLWQNIAEQIETKLNFTLKPKS